nr:immunoglobulin heavy chain junction region [Macaca mulatta]MOW47191.1 immunoglobulin heavy chain junction region [Macaca mulatta]MOW47641.1 immunoglobulin heavy chain junction region [Macaca mulatta]MOW47762.1 immunoglobulin heavy chain junction region [Macaca mulatta]MOW50045.1 immunoglobulin heavy chain junction region [Macaca mulatta]
CARDAWGYSFFDYW